MSSFHIEYEPILVTIENGSALRFHATDPAVELSFGGRSLVDSPINACSVLSRFALSPEDLPQDYEGDEHEMAVIGKLTTTSVHAHMANIVRTTGEFAATTGYFYDAYAGVVTMERYSHNKFGDGNVYKRPGKVPLHETLYYNFGREPSGVATLRYTTNDLHMIRDARKLHEAKQAGSVEFHALHSFAKTAIFFAGNVLGAAYDKSARPLLDPETDLNPSVPFKTPALAGLYRVLLRQRGITQPSPKSV